MTHRESYRTLSAKAQREVRELAPWDVARLMKEPGHRLILDVRERAEFAVAHIAGSLNVPRGILEAACEWDYEETEPELVVARDQPIIVVCRSGNRSALAAQTLALIGYREPMSMRLGIKGWNDSDLPLIDATGAALDGDAAALLLSPPLAREKLDPVRRKA